VKKAFKINIKKYLFNLILDLRKKSELLSFCS
jgi:hypothetical protein